MSVKFVSLSIIACGLAIASFASPANAFCDLLSYNGFGLSQDDAIKNANDKGLVRVRQLDRKYGSRVKYDKATWKCSGGDHVSCTITQRYCIAGLDDTGEVKGRNRQ